MAAKSRPPSVLPSQVSVDTSPMPPLDAASMSSSNVSADALAGPEDARRLGTEELKAAEREAAARQQVASQQQLYQQTARPSNLEIEKLPAKGSYSSSGSGSRAQLDQIESEIRYKLDHFSLSKESDSSYGSMSSGESWCSSMPSLHWENELKEYMDRLPPYLRMGYIDVLILYCEDDREKAEKFRDHLMNDIEIENGPMIAMLYDAEDMQAICGSKIQHLAAGVERSTYVFIYMTKNFISDKWCEFSSESCLMEAITNPDKQWCVVPVYTEKRNNSFRVPMGLNTLKGINYYNNDKFYRKGVARLIGDKIYVRMKKNEEHKIKQKAKIEEIKREELILKENQRRIQQIEEAKTQQCIEWLNHETKRFIRDGVLPGSILHSSSESDVSSIGSSLSHSASTGSLQPVHPQNPAVKAYFQQLLAQQKAYGRNEQNYSFEQVQAIERMFGSPSPPFVNQNHMLTQGIRNQQHQMQHPLQMNLIQGQGQMNQGQGEWFQGQHGYISPVRNPSQQSADMHPSSENAKNSVPPELYEAIKDLPEREQQEHVQSYWRQLKEATPRKEFDDLNSHQSGNISQKCSIGNQGQMQPFSAALPNMSMLESNSMSSYGSAGLGNTSQIYSNESTHLRTNTGIPNSEMSGRVASGQTRHGNSMDTARSNDQGNENYNGNLPCLSVMDEDGGSIQQSFSSQGEPSQQTYSKGRQSVTVNGKQIESRQGRQSDKSESEDSGAEDSDDAGVVTKEKSTRKKTNKTVIKKVYQYQYHIYKPGAVQIGDGNIVNQTEGDFDLSDGDDDSTELTSESGVQEPAPKKMSPVTESKMSDDPKMNKMEIEPGTRTHCEIGDQPEAPRSAGSCMPDAAPSTHQPRGQSLLSSEPQINPLKDRQKGLISTKQEVMKSQIASKPEIKSYDDKITDNSSKFEDIDDSNTAPSQTDDKGLEGSVNVNSSIESSKSSSSQKVIIPVSPFVSAKPKTDVKRQEKAKPVAAIQPFSPGSSDDNDENCEYTEPKRVASSEQTNVKYPSGASNLSEETCVKQAWVDQAPQKMERPDRSPQLCTKSRASCDTKKEAPFLTSQQSNPQRLFYNNRFPPNEDEGSNVDKERSLSIDNIDDPDLELGEDPLNTTGPPETENFMPGSTPFTPVYDFELLDREECVSSNSNSLQESGSRVNNSWQSKGSLSHSGSNTKSKECVIS